MKDITNPYANPYLPSFVSQRPVMNNQISVPQINTVGTTFSQIHPVDGFGGADAYAAGLANGASEIVSEKDPNIARVYVVAKDQSGQVFVQGLRVTPEERPKAVTMDDLLGTMNQILERVNKLEGDRTNDQSNHGVPWQGAKQPGNAAGQSNGRNGQTNAESRGGNAAGNGK